MQDMHPFSVDYLAGMPTLAMGCGFFFWIPLCVAFGRRPIIILSAVMFTIASLGAGFSNGFASLLACVCSVGFSGGASIGVVSTPSSSPCYQAIHVALNNADNIHRHSSRSSTSPSSTSVPLPSQPPGALVASSRSSPWENCPTCSTPPLSGAALTK